jgi:PAS domain S-box-containing protein
MRRIPGMSMKSKNGLSSHCYLWALGAVILATAVAVQVRPISSETPFLFFLPAVFFALWVGGFSAAIFSSVLSVIAVDFFLMPPLYSFRVSARDLVKEVLFLVIMSVMAWLFERMRIRAESALQLRQKLLEAAAESILITDADRSIIYWSNGAEQLYGWTQSEALGKSPQTLLQTSNQGPRENMESQLHETGHWRGPLARISKSGRRVVTQTALAIDKETGHVLEASLDITAQALAESELKRVNRALSALSRVSQSMIHAISEEELLHQAVDIIVHDGGYPLAWIAIPNNDPEQTLTVVALAGPSSAYLENIRITWGDEPSGRGPTGTALRESRTVVVQDYATASICEPWREHAEAYNLRSGVCFPLIVEDKTVAALTVYASEKNAFENQELELISELAGNLTYGIRTARMQLKAEEDCKSRQLLEEQFRQVQKMEAVGRLAGGIAHDFNNLLMIIMAQTELLSMQLEGDALVRTESVMRSARKAAELTGQLLAFSRKQIVQPKVFSLNPVLTETAQMAEHLVGEDIRINLVLAPQLCPIRADRSQIEQVVLNLIVNARDAMPQGGELTIETANADIHTEYDKPHPIMPAGKYVMLAVCDTGKGMDEDTQARLFEPFFTTKAPGKGTGLGLSMVYGIVKQNEGFVWFDSKLGEGTRFKIYLPVPDATVTGDESVPAPVANTARKHATVLLVEDEDALRSVVAEFLRSDDHKVISAQSYEEALERAAENGDSIDLLLTDVVLKGRSGKQLADNLHYKGYQLQVIFMSGYTPDAIVHHGVLDEGTLFLQKPFTCTSLLDKIQQALNS